MSHLPRFGVCESALAAADFSAFDDFGLFRTFAAAVAAFALVCRVFRAMCSPPFEFRASRGGQAAGMITKPRRLDSCRLSRSSRSMTSGR